MAPRASSVPDERSHLAPLSQIVLLALWLGAATFFAAVVAPAAFDVLPTRELAGALVGRALPVVFVSGMAVGVIALLLEGARAPRPNRPARRVAACCIVAACAIAQFIIAPRIATIRGQLTVPLASLATDDPLRVAFGRQHMWSVGWLALAMLAAAGTLVLTASPLRRSNPT